MLAYVNFGVFASDLSPQYVGVMAALCIASLYWGVERALLFQSSLSSLRDERIELVGCRIQNVAYVAKVG